MVEEVFERSIYRYPGHNSIVINLDSGLDIQKMADAEKMERISALLIKSHRWNAKIKDAFDWAKGMKLKVGLEIDYSFDIEKIMEGGLNFDFIRINGGGAGEEIKSIIGKIRAHGIRHEVVCEITSFNEKGMESIWERYKACNPCDSFVIKINNRPDDSSFNKLMKFNEKYKNLILRFER